LEGAKESSFCSNRLGENKVRSKKISAAPEQNQCRDSKALFGGGKLKLCDTLRALTF
jgi:hypothetical protein